MKHKFILYLLLAAMVSACGGNKFSRYPQPDQVVYQLIDDAKKEKITVNTTQLKQAYEAAIQDHLQKISQYSSSSLENKWDKILKEYDYLQKLAGAVSQSSAGSAITIQRFEDEYAVAKEKVLNNKYESAITLLDNYNRQDAQKAYSLLRDVRKLDPDYRSVNSLLKEAERASILAVVVSPVNYYSQSYGYWGLNNDYIQQQLVTDLKNQVASGTIKVYTEYEARNKQIVPDRLIDISWTELFVPMPFTNTSSRQVSKEIQTGTTTDNKPVYTTVKATIYITQKTLRARGNLELRITDPTNNKTVLWEQFPAQYNWQEEYATFQGDKRALSSYDLALISRANSSMNDPSRYEVYNQVFSQVYPRLLSRIRSVTW